MKKDTKKRIVVVVLLITVFLLIKLIGNVYIEASTKLHSHAIDSNCTYQEHSKRSRTAEIITGIFSKKISFNTLTLYHQYRW